MWTSGRGLKHVLMGLLGRPREGDLRAPSTRHSDGIGLEDLHDVSSARRLDARTSREFCKQICQKRVLTSLLCC